ncbi:MAG: glycoside hydrolase family 3 protein [candidate division Zixibacteria bacterium]|nr:glycoside hydrolase family 3 protein [candidate division Zixibacteria bacterium]
MIRREQERQLGRLFVVGFPGPEPPAAFKRFLVEDQIGGVILFEENCPSDQKTRENVETLRHASGLPHLLVAIDQEGGRVCRLRGAPAEFRSAESYVEKGGLEHFREDYGRSTVYMESLGINLNLAPVADIYLNESNTVLKGRCFGRTPDQVSSFVKVAVATAAQNGILSCLKHFPGLGAVDLDPHVATPRLAFNEIVWTKRDLVPFIAGIEAGADLIMTTHVVLEPFDTAIATGSARVIDQLLRDRAGFDGPVITDDLLMEGAASLGSVGERAVAAFLAGHDILLFGRDFEAAMTAFDYFSEACRRGEISSERLAASLERVNGLKYKLRRAPIG